MGKVLLILLFVLIFAENSSAADTMRDFTCKQPVPVFTLGPNSDPSDEQLKILCECIWSKFPENSWERRTSTKIRNGEDPGWRGQALVSRFGDALKSCGGYSL